jgi:ATP-dependent protease HslVU (ClpYQ) ATPase subunit
MALICCSSSLSTSSGLALSPELRKHIENMKEKLRQRKDRKKPGSLTADEEQNLSDEEKRKLLETREMQNDADRLMEEKAVVFSVPLICH